VPDDSDRMRKRETPRPPKKDLELAREDMEWFTPERARLVRRVLEIEAQAPGISSEVRGYFETVCRRIRDRVLVSHGGEGVIKLTKKQAAEFVAAARDLFIWAATSSRGKSEPNHPPRKQKKSAIDPLDRTLLAFADKYQELGFVDEKALVASLTATPEGRARWRVTRYEGKPAVADLARDNLLRRIRELRSKLPK
jgi:hypothetical protein